MAQQYGAGVCGDRWEEGRVVRVSLRETRGCQRQVEQLGMEQKIEALYHFKY